jgi:acyl carrier protein
MDDNETLRRIQVIFDEMFLGSHYTVTRGSSAKDLAAWDSLRNIQIVVGVEEAFSISFTAKEVESFRNVGDMVDLIHKKRGTAAR